MRVTKTMSPGPLCEVQSLELSRCSINTSWINGLSQVERPQRISLRAGGPHQSSPVVISLSGSLLVPLRLSTSGPQAVLTDGGVVSVGVVPGLWDRRGAPGGFPAVQTPALAPSPAAAGRLGRPGVGAHRHRQQHRAQDHRGVQQALSSLQPAVVSAGHKDHTPALAWRLPPQAKANLVFCAREEIIHGVRVDSRADVDHLLPEGFIRCNIEREPRLRSVRHRKPLQQDPVHRLLDHPQVNIGTALRGGEKRTRCEQGLGGLHAEGDDHGTHANGVGGHAGVIASVYQVGRRYDQLRQSSIFCSKRGQHWWRENKTTPVHISLINSQLESVQQC